MALFASQDYTLVLGGTGQDLALASVLKIRYEDPNGIEGELVALYQGTDNGDAYVDIPASLNSIVGGWKFQIEAFFTGRTYLSSKAFVKINEPLGDPTP